MEEIRSELSIYKLGSFLYKVTKEYKVVLQIKLSGGLAMTGKAEI